LPADHRFATIAMRSLYDHYLLQLVVKQLHSLMHGSWRTPTVISRKVIPIKRNFVSSIGEAMFPWNAFSIPVFNYTDSCIWKIEFLRWMRRC